MAAAAVERLVFALNGRRYEVAAADVDPSTRLVEFIRTRTPFKGTKLGCGEGTLISSVKSCSIHHSLLVKRSLSLSLCVFPACITTKN